MEGEGGSRDEAGGLKLELINAKELSGISHLIRRATRLLGSLARARAARSWDKEKREKRRG